MAGTSLLAPSKTQCDFLERNAKNKKFKGSAGENREAVIEKWELSMIALQLDNTQKTPFLVEALDGAHIKYTKMLSEEITLWHTLGWKIN